MINQPINNLEYIIVDGASDDGTLDIVKRYKDERFKVVSEKEVGSLMEMNGKKVCFAIYM